MQNAFMGRAKKSPKAEFGIRGPTQRLDQIKFGKKNRKENENFAPRGLFCALIPKLISHHQPLMITE